MRRVTVNIPIYCELFFCFISAIHQVTTLCLNAETVAGHFVQRSLPPAMEVIQRIPQSFAPQLHCIHIEYRHLLTGKPCELLRISGGHKRPVIGQHRHLQSHPLVFHEQADVSQGMVFPLACSPHEDNPSDALGSQKGNGFRLVVGLLFRDAVYPVVKTHPVRFRE